MCGCVCVRPGGQGGSEVAPCPTTDTQPQRHRARLRERKEKKMKKEICKNCANCKPTYKGGVCEITKKKVNMSKGTCEKWREKK